jgi:cell division protein FtsQ
MKGKKWFIALQRLMVLAIVITSLAFAESKVDDVTLSQVEVNVYSEAGHRFIESSELETQVFDFLGDTSQMVLSEINISMLEEKLQQYPSVEHAEVYFDLNGVLCANVSQRNPFLRVLNGDNKGYWDKNGNWFPVAKNYTTNLPLVLGTPDSTQILKAIAVHEKLISDPFYADFVSAYEWLNDDLILYPRYGVSEVNWGNPNQLFDSKRNRLKKAYKKVFPAMGFDRYKSINLKFADQVVGIKREDHGGR